MTNRHRTKYIATNAPTFLALFGHHKKAYVYRS